MRRIRNDGPVPARLLAVRPLWYNGLVRTAQDEAQNDLAHALGEIRQLKDTISSMREQMEEMRGSEQQRIQQATTTASQEVVHLRATVQALREEMERQKFGFEEKVQALQTTSHSEIGQLQRTIVDLRERLEKANGAG
jgi:hypothetical protein